MGRWLWIALSFVVFLFSAISTAWAEPDNIMRGAPYSGVVEFVTVVILLVVLVTVVIALIALILALLKHLKS